MYCSKSWSFRDSCDGTRWCAEQETGNDFDVPSSNLTVRHRPLSARSFPNAWFTSFCGNLPHLTFAFSGGAKGPYKFVLLPLFMLVANWPPFPTKLLLTVGGSGRACSNGHSSVTLSSSGFVTISPISIYVTPLSSLLPASVTICGRSHE